VAAVGLKKYRGGGGGVSKMADNEDAAASLGHAEPLSVQHPPGEPIPEVGQRPEDGAKVASAGRRQQSGDVFEWDSAMACSRDQAHEVEEQP
jgi:hypothetical protein